MQADSTTIMFDFTHLEHIFNFISSCNLSSTACRCLKQLKLLL